MLWGGLSSHVQLEGLTYLPLSKNKNKNLQGIKSMKQLAVLVISYTQSLWKMHRFKPFVFGQLNFCLLSYVFLPWSFMALDVRHASWVVWLVVKPKMVQFHFIVELEGMRNHPKNEEMKNFHGVMQVDNVWGIVRTMTKRGPCKSIELPLVPKKIMLPWWGPELENILRSPNMVRFHFTLSLKPR